VGVEEIEVEETEGGLNVSDASSEDYALTYTSDPSCVVRFVLAGDNLRPTEVTQLLGKEPYRSWAKGDEIYASNESSNFKPRRRRLIGYWSIVPEGSKHDELDHQIQRLLALLEHLPSIIHELILKYNGEISIGYSSSETNIGILLEKNIISRIYSLGLSINIDIYPVREE